MNARPNSFAQGPDARAISGNTGGRYVAETLMPLILDLDRLRRREGGQAFRDRWTIS